MKTKKILVAAVLLATYSMSGMAQSAGYRFSLSEALDYGLKNSVSIRLAVADQEQAQHKVGEVKSSSLPQVNAEGQLQDMLNIPTQLIPGEIFGAPGTSIPVQFGVQYNVSATIKASQVLYNQQLFTGIKAAKSSNELYALMKIKSEQDVIYQVSKAFYESLKLKSQIQVLDSNLAMISRIEKLMEYRYENDVVTKTDFNRIKVNKSNLSTQLQALTIGYEQQLNYLKLLMGMPISEELELVENEDMNEINAQTLDFKKLQPIDIQILDKQKSLYALNKKAINAGYAPTLAAFAQQGWNAQRADFDFFDTSKQWFPQTVVGLQLQVPIFDGLSKHHQAQQTKIDLEKVELNQLNAERQLDMAYENARKQLDNSIQMVDVQSENRALAKEVYEQTQSLYSEQVAGITDLLDAEKAYREAENNYYTEILKFKIAELELLKAQGQLNTMINN